MTTSKRAAVLAALILPVTGFAQFEPTTREALHGCAVLESVPRRLECIDSVLERAASRAGTEDATDAAPGGRSEAAAADSRAAADGEADSDARDSQPRRQAESPREAGTESAQDAETGAAGSGERLVVVVDVTQRIPGRAVFTTAGGRRLMQTSGGSRLFLPDVPFEAELRDGSLGSRFLAPLEQGRTVRVATPD